MRKLNDLHHFQDPQEEKPPETPPKNRLKRFFSWFFKWFKKDKTKLTVPAINQKVIISRILLGLCILIILFVLIFIARSFRYNHEQKQARTQISQLSSELKNIKAHNGNTDNIDVFSKEFVTAYYHTKLEQEDYNDNLKKFIAKDMEVPKVSKREDEKTIQNISLWHKEVSPSNENLYNLSYLVDYQVGKNKGVSKEIINFKVEKNKDNYSVVTYPYFESFKDNQNVVDKKLILNQPSSKPLDNQTSDNLMKWLDNTFLPRYFKDTSLDEMSYMMRNAETLGDSRNYEKLKDTTVYQENKQFIIFANVLLTDKATNQEEIQSLKIVIETDKNNKNIVQSIEHY